MDILDYVDDVDLRFLNYVDETIRFPSILHGNNEDDVSQPGRNKPSQLGKMSAPSDSAPPVNKAELQRGDATTEGNAYKNVRE